MEYTPIPKNKKYEVAAVVLLVTAVVLFFFGSEYYVKWRALVQALGVACLALSSFFIIKRLTSYTYSVFPKDRDTKKSVSDLAPDELTFIISKRFGGAGAGSNRASFDLGELKSVEPLPSGAEKKRLTRSKGKMSLYYFTVTFRAPGAYLLVFETGGAPTGIVIEPDGDYIGFLEEAARINRNSSPLSS